MVEGYSSASPQLLIWFIFAAVPLFVVACTAFAKVAIVFSALRIGLGAENLLPYIALLTLALLVTGVIMTPAIELSWGLLQSHGGWATSPQAWLDFISELAEPWFRFLKANAAERQLEFFSEISGRATDHPTVLIGGFLITELGEALRISVIVLAPFVAVDLITVHLISMLGIQLSTSIVTLPVKILLFLAIDGWQLLISGLAAGYQ